MSGVWKQIKWLRIWIYICWLLLCFFYILLFQTANFVQGKIYHKHSVKHVLINVSIFDINNIFWTPLSVTVSICVIQVSDKSISLQFVCIPFDNGKFRVHSVLLFIHKFLSLSFLIIKILKVQCMMLISMVYNWTSFLENCKRRSYLNRWCTLGNIMEKNVLGGKAETFLII